MIILIYLGRCPWLNYSALLVLLNRGPSERVSRWYIFDDQLTPFGFAVSVAHKFSELDRRRKIVTVGILKCAERAALLHEMVDLEKDPLPYLVRHRDEGQTADDRSYFSQAGFSVYIGSLEGISADDLHVRI